jgi:V8-like Glu-specific endopeptidase
MLVFFFVFSSAPLKQEAAAAVSETQKQVTPALINTEPYCAIGFVKATFSEIKLKEKGKNSFQIVAVQDIACGTGLWIQPGVVVTAAHVVMPKKFVLEEPYVNIFESINDGQLPDKVEFFQFYPPYETHADVQEPRLLQREANYSPQSASGEDFDIRQHEEKQEILAQYFVVPQKWKDYLSKLATQKETTIPAAKSSQAPHGQNSAISEAEKPISETGFSRLLSSQEDYALVLFSSDNKRPGVHMLKNFNPETTRERVEGCDVLSVGYPTSIYNAAEKKEEKYEATHMFEFYGKALFGGATFMHDCRVSKGCSGGPVLVKGKNGNQFVIGLNVLATSVTDSLMRREAVLFTDRVITFIENSLKERGKTPTLQIKEAKDLAAQLSPETRIPAKKEKIKCEGCNMT